MLNKLIAYFTPRQRGLVSLDLSFDKDALPRPVRRTIIPKVETREERVERERRTFMMKLVVGQDVYMDNVAKSTTFYRLLNGKVIKVTPECVEVEARDPFGGSHNLIWRFDTQRTSNDHSGPWVIDTLPFEERKADIENSKRREERRLEVWHKIHSKLVVGQEVFIASGIYYVNGTVTKVAPEGVEVFVPQDNGVRGTNQVWRFDTQGRTSDGGGGTAEYGRWEIEDMPFEERKAKFEELERRRKHWKLSYTPTSWEDNLHWQR